MSGLAGLISLHGDALRKTSTDLVGTRLRMRLDKQVSMTYRVFRGEAIKCDSMFTTAALLLVVSMFHDTAAFNTKHIGICLFARD